MPSGITFLKLRRPTGATFCYVMRWSARKLSIRGPLSLPTTQATSILEDRFRSRYNALPMVHLRHLKGLQLAAMMVVLTGCDGDNKIWIVVDLKMPNGKVTQMSFDDPRLADVDLQTCEQTLKGSLPILMQEIDGMPETKGSSLFRQGACNQRKVRPLNSYEGLIVSDCNGLLEKTFGTQVLASWRFETLRRDFVLGIGSCRAPDRRENDTSNTKSDISFIVYCHTHYIGRLQLDRRANRSLRRARIQRYQTEERNMAVVYVEPVPRGRPDGDPITVYAVETHAGEVLKTLDSQQDAIDWAKAQGYIVHVARVRNTDKDNPEHWQPS